MNRSEIITELNKYADWKRGTETWMLATKDKKVVAVCISKPTVHLATEYGHYILNQLAFASESSALKAIEMIGEDKIKRLIYDKAFALIEAERNKKKPFIRFGRFRD